MRPLGRWLLQDAKARSANSCGVSAAKALSRSPCTDARKSSSFQPKNCSDLESDRSGGALIAALQASPWREIDIEPPTDAGS